MNGPNDPCHEQSNPTCTALRYYRPGSVCGFSEQAACCRLVEGHWCGGLEAWGLTHHRAGSSMSVCLTACTGHLWNLLLSVFTAAGKQLGPNTCL
ncbi:unnamed protein product [Boreogadus saida]